MIFHVFFLNWYNINLFPELMDFKTRRVAAVKKNLVELGELELKHANVIGFIAY